MILVEKELEYDFVRRAPETKAPVTAFPELVKEEESNYFLSAILLFNFSK